VVQDTCFPQYLRYPVAQPASTKFGTRVIIATYSPNPSSIPNVKLLPSTVAEIRRDPNFLDTFLAQTHANFIPKVVFFGK